MKFQILILIACSTLTTFEQLIARNNNYCPDAHIPETNQTLQFLLENEYLLPFKVELSFHGLSLQDFHILSSPEDSFTCTQITSKGFYTEAIPISVGKTYYKVNDMYVVLVRFQLNEPVENENGTISFTTSPSGAIAIYDQNFEVIHSFVLL